MKKENKNIVLWAVLIVMVVVASAWYYQYSKNRAAEQVLQGNAPIATQNGAAAGATQGQQGLVDDVTAASLSYTEAVTIFANQRVQFDPTCRMLPTNPVFKSGTTIMFDNRSANPTSFSLDGQRYNLAGYGFKLFTLSANKIPHTITVNCGTGKNTGTIELE